MEFMQTQDKRSAHQEKCISDISTQVGKLAKAVEGLCGALGPAMRDSIDGTLGPQVRELRDVAHDVRRAAGDLNAAATVIRQQPAAPMLAAPGMMAPYQVPVGAPSSPLGSAIPPGTPAGVAARQDAALLATALVPEIEHIVAEALGKSLAHPGGALPPGRGGGAAAYLHTPAAAAGYGRASVDSVGGGGGAAAEPAPPSAAEARRLEAEERAKISEEAKSAAAAKKAKEEREKELREAKRAKDEAKAKAASAEAEAGKTESSKDAAGAEKKAAKGAPVNSKALSEEEVKKIHSAIRWNKPLGELAGLITGAEQANCEDSRNGNRPIHIASQNGFTPICKLLVAKGAEIDAVNGKGNTGLHMALGYDYDECAAFLTQCGADQTIVNAEGHAAKNGLEGDKGPDGYVAPLAELRDARTVEESMKALARITSEGLGNDDKAALVQCGLLKKKNFPDSWTPKVQDAFRELMMSL